MDPHGERRHRDRHISRGTPFVQLGRPNWLKRILDRLPSRSRLPDSWGIRNSRLHHSARRKPASVPGDAGDIPERPPQIAAALQGCLHIAEAVAAFLSPGQTIRDGSQTF